MNQFSFVLALVTFSLTMASGIVYGVITLIRFLGNRPGGLGYLARTYPMTGSEPEPTLTRQTLKIGAVRYKNIGKMTVGRDALYLKVWGHTAKIPWSEIKGVGETWFQWQKWPVLQIGDPRIAEIVISPEAYRAMKDRIEMDSR